MSILKINIYFTIYIYNKFAKCGGFLTGKKIYLLFGENTIIMEIKKIKKKKKKLNSNYFLYLHSSSPSCGRI